MMPEEYIANRNAQVKKNINNTNLCKSASQFLQQIHRTNYVKNFTWMGRPILQFPSDMFVMQELIYNIQPDFVIETGMAFGGSAVFYAQMMKELAFHGSVITIDVEIRDHNRKAISNGEFWDQIIMVEGDSTNPDTFKVVKDMLWPDADIIVCLDSNHTKDHVLAEMELYGQLVKPGSYMVVFDTAIAYVMDRQPEDRPWGPGNNPLNAVMGFMERHGDEWVIDREVEMRALITAAPSGWLRRIK